ncbi:MAG: hypothetical protein IKY70_02730 [Bacteroidales bacterium]|nr:hypothetical protein [Bacteroidales bacterium]
MQNVFFAYLILPIIAFILCPLSSSKGMSILMSLAMLCPALYDFISSESADLPTVAYTIFVVLGLLSTLILNAGKQSEEKEPEERHYNDSKLKEILQNPESYHPEFVAKCKKELEIREESKSLAEKVIQFDDVKIEEILSNTATYSLALAYCCKQEKDRRNALKAEELKKQEEEQRRLYEQQERERQEKIVAWWRKWKIHIILISIITFAILGNLIANRLLIYQYRPFYDKIVVQKNHHDIDSTTISQIEAICDKVIEKPLISKIHKGNVYHLKSYLGASNISLMPDEELLSKAKDFKSPLAIAEAAIPLLFDNSSYNENDKNKTIEMLQKLNTVEADIILAAYEFLDYNYSKAYEILMKNIKKSTNRFKTDNLPMAYDESYCLTTLGYNILGILHYIGVDDIELSVTKAKHYLCYNSLIEKYSDAELANYLPKTEVPYFYRIRAQVYDIIGDLLFMGYANEKYTYRYDNLVLNLICGSFHFYSAADHIAPFYIEELEDKIKITENIHNAKIKRYRGLHGSRSKDFKYHLNRNDWGVEFTERRSEQIKSVAIGQFYNSSNSYSYDSYDKRGLFMVIEENLINDTYNVELKYFY